MEPLPPIPASQWSRWLYVRWPLVHGLVFLGICALVVVVWRHLQTPGTFIGQVEVLEVTVSSRDAGFLTNLWVQPLQQVQPGDLVAEVITTDPRTVNNRLEAMRDRMRLTALELDPVLRRERSALAYEQLSVDRDRVNAELRIAEVRLLQAQGQLARDDKLHHQGVLSDELFELSQRNRDAFQVEILEKSNLVQRTQLTLDRLRAMTETFVPGGENDPIKQALAVEEDKMRVFESKMTPLAITAPTNGIITAIHRHAGEQVLAGQPIATITLTHSTRVIGFLPSTVSLEPEVGMEVWVMTRSRQRRQGCARVLGVSPHYQLMTNALLAPAVVRPVPLPPVGRLISISLPPELKLKPGEPVDLSLRAPPGTPITRP